MKRYFILLAAVALLAACNKDTDEVQPTQGDTPKRLASLTSISYSQYRSYNYETGQYELSHTSGSKSGATFRWSSTGLLTGMGMDGIAGDLITVEYDGDKMKKININNAAVGASYDVSYTCTYTGDNLTQLYASIPGQGWAMTTLRYSPDGELLSLREEDNEGSLTTTTLVWGNGNVTHVERTQSNPRSSGSRTYTFDYVYDNMTSLYSGFTPYALISNDFYMLSKNNVLRAIDNYHSSGYDTTVYIYNYDGDWPVSYTINHGNQSSYSNSYRSESKSYLRYTDGSGASIPQTYRIDVTSNMPDDDFVHVYGGGDYEAGKQVVLHAEYNNYTDTPRNEFNSWSDSITDNPRIITASGNATYTAIFNSSDNPPDGPPDGPLLDTTGLEITDSIVVRFGDTQWKTLSYTSRVERDTVTNFFEWVYIEAHYPGATYPYFELKVLREVGEHTGFVNTSSPTGTYTMPSNTLVGDMKCGNLKYYSNDSVMEVLHMPDGTVRADWWADSLTTNVLRYDSRESRLTARCSGVMFNYMQWYLALHNGAPINVVDARKKPIAISFGGLQIAREKQH